MLYGLYTLLIEPNIRVKNYIETGMAHT